MYRCVTSTALETKVPAKPFIPHLFDITPGKLRNRSMSKVSFLSIDSKNLII